MGSRMWGVGTDIIEIDRVISACKKDSFLQNNYSEEGRQILLVRRLLQKPSVLAFLILG